MNQHLQSILNFIELDKDLSADEKNALLKSLKDADKEFEISAFKLDRTEKVKRTTAILLEETIEELEQKRKAVEAQNKELEIESSLERVRTVAMSMNKPDDMLDVCKIISQQLELLNVKEIRNVQTAIFYKEKGMYMNYEYYAKHNKTIVTETSYTNNKIHLKFAEKMLKGYGEFMDAHITGDEVKAWVEYQKTTNVFIDDYLYTASSLNYYWFSLDSVALGISTYDPLKEEDINLFRRFLKVFELAYRRYLDIEKAEAQLHEAKIEASLERMRAAAMSMQKSDEIIHVSESMYKQLASLGFTNIRNAQIAIQNETKQAYTVFEYSDFAAGKGEAAYNSSHIVQELYNELGKTKDAFYQKEFSGKEFEEWRKWRKTLPVSSDSRIDTAESVCFYLYSFGTGHLGISTFNPIREEQIEILKRFKKVFELSYQRYTDVAKAEAQAKEAQIELALERVRARTMAMQRSDELAETVFILFQQFKQLGENPDQATIGIINEGERVIEYWVTMYGNQTNRVYKFPIDEPNVTNRIYKAWKEQKKSLVIELSGKELYDFATYRASMGGAAYNKKEKKRVINVAFFSKGLINVQSNESRSEESIRLLERFAGVFEQTYTRFLDLQKAEAQAREAQIELGLERVRARAMAMQKSDELSELVDTVFKELTKLDFALTWCIINIIDEPSLSNTVWAANPDIDKAPESYYMKFEDYPFHHAMMKGWKERKTKYVYVLEGSEKKIYDDYLFSETEFKRTPEPAQAASRAMEKYVVSFSFSNFGGIQTVGDIPLSDANLDILSRFGKVFDLTYTRFNDLKQAETQARESQIQLALERVRARTMAMQKSDELAETSFLLFQQFRDLGEKAEQISIGIINKEERIVELSATLHGNKLQQSFKLKVDDSTMQKKTFDGWKKQKKSIVIDMTGIELHDYNVYRKKLGQFDVIAADRWIVNIAFFSKGFLAFSTHKPRPAESILLLERFAKVFEQTYTRFLDLQKAEAQARESQIQLAMERVRARTMAMQKSDELPDAANILFQQVQTLGMPAWSAGYCIWDDDKQAITAWMSSEGVLQPPFRVPLTEEPTFIHMREALERGESFYVDEISGEVCKTHYEYMRTLPSVGKILDSIIEAGHPLPTFQIMHMAYFSQGFLLFITYEPVPQAHDIFKRFGNVFEQTYTRFLDLQKAEAQAREAKIETALEKVRSRSMGMQKSEELKEVIQLVYEQFVHLNINVEHTGFIMDYKEKNDMHIWLADKHAVPFQVTIPYFDSAHWNSFNEAKEKGMDFFANHLSFEEKNKFYHDLFKLIPGVPEETLNYYFSCPGLAISTALLENIGLYIENFSGIPYRDEENNTLMRFGKVFQQTYTRFLDLQKAEAQAREATIEAALERVRSISLAMHKSGEIIEVVRAVFERLNELNIELNTAFIIIFKQGSCDTEWWLINKDKGEYSSILVEYADIAILKEMFEIKEQGKELFSATYHSEEKNELFRYLFTQTDFKYAPPERQKFIFESEAVSISMAMTNKIAIQITRHNETSFSEGDNEILKRFTKVFDQSYTRFLDLQKAEAQARESQIEAALERVRSRTLAMRASDELAETSAVLFKQLILLGIEPNRLYIAVIKNETGDSEFWITDEDGAKVSSAFESNLNDNKSFKKMYKGWKQNKKSLMIDMKGKELQEYFQHLSNIYVPFKGGLSQKRRLQYIAYFNKGFIGMASPEEQPRETMHLLERFAAVFNLTFTRFNDLKIAEAHAIQAEQDLIEIKTARQKAEDALDELKTTQKQLIQSEKMASLGELTAGIAHEIQNPLNFVNNFSEVNKELLVEMNDEIQKGNFEEVKAIAKDVTDNEEKINHHGRRADAIVKGMLQHSRSSTNVKEPTDINKLADEYLRLAYHGLRAKDKSFNTTLKTDYDESIGNINIIPQDIGRVILNLITNAFYAVQQKEILSKGLTTFEKLSTLYEPMVSVSTKKSGNQVSIIVSDNGNGIPPKVLDKIFQPFFTTKPTGEGTGLGLSLSYDIVKAHGGEIKAETKEGEGSEFIISMPIK